MVEESGLPLLKGWCITLEFDSKSNTNFQLPSSTQRYSPASREAKAILDGFNLKPSPTIIDVDVRDDADVLMPILRRLTASDELPVLIVAGELVGTIEDIRKWKADGTLREMIVQSGAMIDGARKKKKH